MTRLLALLLLAPSVALAQTADSPPIRREDGRLVLAREEIIGTPPVPEIQVLVGRQPLVTEEPLKLEQPLLPKVVASVDKAPF